MNTYIGAWCLPLLFLMGCAENDMRWGALDEEYYMPKRSMYKIFSSSDSLKYFVQEVNVGEDSDRFRLVIKKYFYGCLSDSTIFYTNGDFKTVHFTPFQNKLLASSAMKSNHKFRDDTLFYNTVLAYMYGGDTIYLSRSKNKYALINKGKVNLNGRMYESASEMRQWEGELELRKELETDFFNATEEYTYLKGFGLYKAVIYGDTFKLRKIIYDVDGYSVREGCPFFQGLKLK